MRQRRGRRPGLTLLEMVLTTAIAMVILLALFGLMITQYGNLQAGRDAIANATTGRAIATRLASDLANQLGPVDPRFLPNSILPNNANQGAGGGSGGGTGGGGNGSSSTSGTTGSSGTTASSTGSTSSSTSSTSSGSTTTALPYNLGVKGDAKWLVLSINRVPGALIASPKAPVTDSSIVSSDLRSVSYWLIDGTGLARREMANVTADDAPTDQPSFASPEQYVFAPEVVDVLFEYFDGTTWQPSWDGGALGGSDGNTPVGPPTAVAVTVTLHATGPRPSPGEDAQTVQYKHVVALPASNGFTQANQTGQSTQLSGQTLISALQSGQLQPGTNANGSSSSATGGTSGQ